jgi:hypothetical protein
MACQQTFRDGTPDVHHQIWPAVHDIETPSATSVSVKVRAWAALT